MSESLEWAKCALCLHRPPGGAVWDEAVAEPEGDRTMSRSQQATVEQASQVNVPEDLTGRQSAGGR
jgi:hypothetical protein